MLPTILSKIINDISSIKPNTLIILSSLIKSHLDNTLITQSRTWFNSITLSIL